MTVQGMKVDQLRSELAGKGLNSNGKKEALIKELLETVKVNRAILEPILYDIRSTFRRRTPAEPKAEAFVSEL